MGRRVSWGSSARRRSAINGEEFGRVLIALVALALIGWLMVSCALGGANGLGEIVAPVDRGGVRESTRSAGVTESVTWRLYSPDRRYP
jgi:hypothetical protein